MIGRLQSIEMMQIQVDANDAVEMQIMLTLC